MKYPQATLAILAALSASLALADDFKTLDGKEYKDATVTHVEPDGIVVKTKSGISKVYFIELPKETQKRFNYDSQKAAEYSAQQSAVLEQSQKQQEASMQQMTQQAEATQKSIQNVGQQQLLQTLQQSYVDLESKENELAQRLHLATQPGPLRHRGTGKHTYTLQERNPLVDQVPALQNALKDIRRDKGEVRKQIEQLQHK